MCEGLSASSRKGQRVLRRQRGSAFEGEEVPDRPPKALSVAAVGTDTRPP